MELSVSTNWDPDLIEGLRDYPVHDVYGALPADVVGGGRATKILPAVDEKGVEKHIKLVRSLGMRFSYVMNANCMGNLEYTNDWQRMLTERLSWLRDIGAEAVVVSSPYLIELVKERFPYLKVSISVLANVDSFNKAKFYEGIGADTIHIATDVNRDFNLIRALRKALKCELVVLVNESCLLHCPMREYHANIMSHASQTISPTGNHLIDYCLIRCTMMRVDEPSQLIKSPWVRPEDLYKYEEIGIKRFKIAGREKSTPWILRAVRAYSSRSYKGNLLDLLIGLGYGLDPFGSSLPPFDMRIDNTLLDGFIEFFNEKDCRKGCGGCTYCDEWALRVVSVKPRWQEQYVERMKNILKTLASGCFRSPI